MLLEILEAMLKLGLPVAIASGLTFSWLYREGKLDREAGRKATNEGLKQMKQEYKQNKGKAENVGDATGAYENYAYKKWMTFGGGFYGLAALWTFIVNEFADIFYFIGNFSEFSTLLGGGVVGILLALIKNQILNLVTAFVWFNYWSKDFTFIWILVPYLSYLLGIQLAKRDAFTKLQSYIKK